VIVKHLNIFLNKKRQSFPRFYFLSNDELLSILSQTKEVRLVQRHLPKCFEGIDYLTFQDETDIITEINSADQEVVELQNHVNPIDA
jgi:dynein heavy chain, axonemal